MREPAAELAYDNIMLTDILRGLVLPSAQFFVLTGGRGPNARGGGDLRAWQRWTGARPSVPRVATASGQWRAMPGGIAGRRGNHGIVLSATDRF